MNIDLMKRYAEKCLGLAWELKPPVSFTGMETVEALWPLNDLFRPMIHQIRSLDYDAAFCPEADQAIEQAMTQGLQLNWSQVSAGAWRVLLERQQQAIMVALANELEGNSFFSVPEGFSSEQTTVFAMLFLLHGMELPWPPFDRSDFEIPQGSAQATLQLH